MCRTSTTPGARPLRRVLRRSKLRRFRRVKSICSTRLRSEPRFHDDGRIGGRAVHTRKRPHADDEALDTSAEDLRERLEVRVEDDPYCDCPAPVRRFEDLAPLPGYVLASLRRNGISAPMPIQAQALPLVLAGRDVIGLAQTGSGKTLAFLLPAAVHLERSALQGRAESAGKDATASPVILVLVPTRELAVQITDEAGKVFEMSGGRESGRIHTVSVYGGCDKWGQQRRLRYGAQIVVATPGRLVDFVDSGVVSLGSVTYLVLDEADRMLDMGFEPQIRKILGKVPRKRHTLFFTATWPKEVRKLASEILNRPYKVMIGNRDVLKGNQDITQLVRIVDLHQKQDVLLGLLRDAGLTNRDSRGKALVFSNTKRMCDQLSNNLSRFGVPCSSIHGDKDQVQRDDALNNLKSGRIKVLVATDVAARGLDIKGVGLVVNFDPANNTEDYVHRIGRTGRAGAKGFAVTILTSGDAPKVRGIVEVMERTDQHIPDELRKLASTAGGGRRRGKGGGKGKRSRSRSRSRSCSISRSPSRKVSRKAKISCSRSRSRSRSRSPGF
mmetsp:Transcript_70410/g.195964  ORF Transcript_70410/g.195964 Transcript_70410/m.195964 type:complete len:555 (+) Transcript_70410:117-1781(+)